MSRVGRKPVVVPPNVRVAVEGGLVRVEGPRGKLERPVLAEVEIVVEPGRVVVRRRAETKRARAMHGTMRAHLANMVRGVVTPFEKALEISGAGYGAKKEGRSLILNLGWTHPIVREVPADLEVEVPSPVSIVVRGVDRQRVGQFAAELRALRPQDSYKQKGLKYRGEEVRKKAGKAAVGVAK